MTETQAAAKQAVAIASEAIKLLAEDSQITTDMAKVIANFDRSLEEEGYTSHDTRMKIICSILSRK